ncbi:hypothetical protein AGMMS50229_11490 [Campylobacterota bacterium]|nr:hypothetical protein AGMMS50229_11490 [Campylobacterota bacterium]
MLTGIAQNASVAASTVAQSQVKPQNSVAETKPLDRVGELKKQIDAGEYKFDLAKTAEKVAEALS